MTATRAGLPVLTYHSISTRRSVIATDPGWFAETLAALRDAGFRALGLADWIARGRPDEPRGFAIAFDDGLCSILDVADVIVRHRVPATIAVVTGRVDGDNAWPGQRRDVAFERLLSWRELESLADLGFEFAAHGVTHTPFDRLDDAGLARELRGSREAIEDRLGRPCRLLVYPDGASTPRARRAAAFEFSAGFGTTLGYADAAQDPLDLRRIDAHYLRGRRALDALIQGNARPRLRWRRALRSVRRRVVAMGALR